MRECLEKTKSDRSSKEKNDELHLNFYFILKDKIQMNRETTDIRGFFFCLYIHLYLFTCIHYYISTPVMYRFYTDTNRSWSTLTIVSYVHYSMKKKERRKKKRNILYMHIYLLSRLLAAPLSRKPLAKGLLSIFNWVIYQAYHYISKKKRTKSSLLFHSDKPLQQ